VHICSLKHTSTWHAVPVAAKPAVLPQLDAPCSLECLQSIYLAQL
jgi:hypothetical protein